jgi:hypothetical protein
MGMQRTASRQCIRVIERNTLAIPGINDINAALASMVARVIARLLLGLVCQIAQAHATHGTRVNPPSTCPP